MKSRWTTECFRLDPRSLALFRILLGVLLLCDLSIRATALRAHYTDSGVLPRAALNTPDSLSIHTLSGKVEFQATLFVVAGLAATALLVGYRTRLFTAVSWYFLLSLHARNPMLLGGGDTLLRLLLFWSLFLPLNSCWSVDAFRRGSSPSETPTIPRLASAAFILQICFVYWFTVVLKTDPCWRKDGTAIYYALSFDPYVTTFGKHLLDYPRLLRFLTHATFYFEAIGPLFLFAPVWIGPIRFLTVVSFTIFHLVGLAWSLELGLFPSICAVAWVALLPAWFWERLGHILPEAPTTSDSPDRRTSPRIWLLEGVAALVFTFVLLWNVRTVKPAKFDRYFPPLANRVGRSLGLSQYWGMFAPAPIKVSGWYVVQGRLSNGSLVDVWKGGRPVCWDKPRLISAEFSNHRWRKYHVNLSGCAATNRLHYAQHLYRQWNRTHSSAQRLERLEVYFIRYVAMPKGGHGPSRKVLLCQYPPHCP